MKANPNEIIEVSSVADYSVSPDLSIRELLPQISHGPHFFRLVVDAAGQLLGTVTDGDVRRALLQGSEPFDPARVSMRKTPVVGRVGAHQENHAKLEAVRGPNAFLPILKDNGTVDSVLIQEHATPDIKNALIMAGGFGTRMGEKTRSVPKPLLEVGGKPMLEHVIRSIEASGVSKIFVSVHYLKEQFERFVENLQTGCTIELVEETQPLGTIGALGEIADRLESPVLVQNADVLTKTDLRAMARFHHHMPYDVTIGAARYDLHVPFGVIDYDGTGKVFDLREKPRHTHFVAAGIYILGPSTIDLVSRGEKVDMPELVHKAIKGGFGVGTFPIHEYWKDVGRPDDLEEADRDHR